MTNSISLLLIGSFILMIGCAKGSGSAEVSPATDTGRQIKVEDFPNVSNSVYGAWNSDTADFGNGLMYLLTLYFNDHEQIGFKRTCIGSGDEVNAATVVSAEIQNTVFAVKEAAKVTQKGKRITNCTLIVNTGSFSYTLNGDRLEVIFQPGEIKTFTRAKN